MGCIELAGLLLVFPGFPQVRELGVAAQATKLGLSQAQGKHAKTLVFWQKEMRTKIEALSWVSSLVTLSWTL